MGSHEWLTLDHEVGAQRAVLEAFFDRHVSTLRKELIQLEQELAFDCVNEDAPPMTRLATKSSTGTDGSLFSPMGSKLSPTSHGTLFKAFSNIEESDTKRLQRQVTFQIDSFAAEKSSPTCVSRIQRLKPTRTIISLLTGKHMPSWVYAGSKRILMNRQFIAIMTVLTFMDLVLIALASETAIRDALSVWQQKKADSTHVLDLAPQQPVWAISVDIGLAAAFSFELITTCLAYDNFFLAGKDALRNFFDLFIVVCAWLEVWTALVGTHALSDVTTMRFFRIIRCCRTIRIIKVMGRFRQLRVFLICLAGSAMSLFYVLVFLAVVTVVFAIFMMQGIAGALQEHSLNELEIVAMDRLIYFFQSFQRTCVSLVMVVTNGEDWENIYGPLSLVSPYLAIGWFVYIVLMHFGVINLITGLFCELAVARGRADQHVRLLEKQDHDRINLKMLMDVFSEACTAKKGFMSFKEWEQFAMTDRAQSVFAVLDVDISKVDGLWSLLDTRGDGTVDIVEFVSKFMELSGHEGLCTALDMKDFAHQQKDLLAQCLDIQESTARQVDEILACVNAEVRRKMPGEHPGSTVVAI
eukprot:TRINITY_DN26431_c0_g1_i1.p1 TRINITY_DN26431_c0_g1~~TRINITY_DN26431_c0_g1_i1.p1  ORF type:complete len:597 (+),score=78.31 TRINITY_DN26431_c0_g1_i1:49-1791(+)